jgi:hypothetical protein
MHPIKITLTALVIAATVAGSAFAVDGAGSSGNKDRNVSPEKVPTTAQDTYAPAAVTPKSDAQATEGVTGATPNSGETTTDKALLNARQQDDSIVKK